MAQPTPVNTGTRATKNGGGASTLAPSINCTIGNRLLALFEFNVFSGTTAITTPSGWTLVHSLAPTGTQTYKPQIAAFTKIAASTTETCSITTVGTDTYGGGQILEYSGDTGIDTTASTTANNGDSAGTSASITAAAALAVADSAVIVHCTAEAGGGGTSSFSSPATTGYTSVSTSSNDSTLIAYDISRKGVSVTTAPTAGYTWTTGSRYQIGMIIISGTGGGTDNTQTPSGFGLTMSLGTPALLGADKKVTPAGFGLTMSLGTPTITTTSLQTPVGFNPTMSIGSPTVNIISNPTVAPSGFPLTMSLGTPVVLLSPVIQPNGFGLTMSLGSPSVSGGSNPTISPAGFGLTMSQGTPLVVVDKTVQPVGFSVLFSLGTPTVNIQNNVGDKTVNPTGLALTMALGTPLVQLSQILQPVGFGLNMQLGIPFVLGPITAAGDNGQYLGLGLRIGVR